jgi:uncharacterized MAPEG superfamily protein
MTTEFKYLLWSLALTFLLMFVSLIGSIVQRGLPPNIGNRERLPELTGWPGRARRAHLNMIENMVLFAPLIIIADISGRDNSMTELGAELFFWGRLAHAVIYPIGIVYVRTAAWTASVVGLVLIFMQLI